jgi:hypothetical protein
VTHFESSEAKKTAAGLWYGGPDAVSNAIGYAKFYSRSHDAVIRVYDEAGNVIETHEQMGDFKEP